MTSTLLLCVWLASEAARFSADHVPVVMGPKPRRQFDFWIGEWQVQNRNLLEDGSWEDRTRTRARITPVCGGNAILEEWAGPFNGTFMNGFSLRAWNEQRTEWDLVLFWTTNGNGGFGTLTGNFRHGRGEFFSSWTDDGTEITQRYSFSDALPETVRWDSAITRDGGQNWRTDWIMEFSRTRAVKQTTQDRLFAVDWTEGELSPHDDARTLDWMLGEWTGTQTLIDTDGREQPDKLDARMRCKLLNKDCLVLDLLETREPGQADWNEQLAVRAYASRAGRWESWHISEQDPTLRRRQVSIEGDIATFERGLPMVGVTHRQKITRLGDDRIRIEHAERFQGAGPMLSVSVTLLERAR